MFTIRECTETAGLTDPFKTTLLTGKTSEIFEVLNYPELLIYGIIIFVVETLKRS